MTWQESKRQAGCVVTVKATRLAVDRRPTAPALMVAGGVGSLFCALHGIRGGEIVAATGEARILAQGDPLLAFFSNRQMMVLAACMEWFVVGLILWNCDRLRQVALVAQVGTVFLAYRLGLWWIGHEGACSCLGNVTRSIGLSPTMEDPGVKILLGYLVLGSYFLIIWELVAGWKRARHELSTVP